MQLFFCSNPTLVNHASIMHQSCINNAIIFECRCDNRGC